MDERRRQEVLEAVAGAVGLIVDDGFVDERNRRIPEGPVTPGDARPRLGSIMIAVHGRSLRGPMSTGVSVRVREEGFEGRCVATAAHVCQLEAGWLERVRFIPGLRDFEREIESSAAHSLRQFLHYEIGKDRDLAIMRIDGGSRGLGSMSLPSESMERIEDQEVYVVGHAGGRPLDVFAATVGQRVPPCDGSDCRNLRGVNLKLVMGPQPCLSGAPVFAWREGAPKLLGLVKGNFVARIQAYKARVAKLLGAKTALMGVASLEDAMHIMGRSALRGLLDEARSGLGISEGMMEALDVKAWASGVVDSCSEEVDADVYMVFLGGALSTSFY